MVQGSSAKSRGKNCVGSSVFAGCSAPKRNEWFMCESCQNNRLELGRVLFSYHYILCGAGANLKQIHEASKEVQKIQVNRYACVLGWWHMFVFKTPRDRNDIWKSEFNKGLPRSHRMFTPEEILTPPGHKHYKSEGGFAFELIKTYHKAFPLPISPKFEREGFHLFSRVKSNNPEAKLSDYVLQIGQNAQIQRIGWDEDKIRSELRKAQRKTSDASTEAIDSSPLREYDTPSTSDVDLLAHTDDTLLGSDSDDLKIASRDRRSSSPPPPLIEHLSPESKLADRRRRRDPGASSRRDPGNFGGGSDDGSIGGGGGSFDKIELAERELEELEKQERILQKQLRISADQERFYEARLREEYISARSYGQQHQHQHQHPTSVKVDPGGIGGYGGDRNRKRMKRHAQPQPISSYYQNPQNNQINFLEDRQQYLDAQLDDSSPRQQASFFMNAFMDDSEQPMDYTGGGFPSKLAIDTMSDAVEGELFGEQNFFDDSGDFMYEPEESLMEQGFRGFVDKHDRARQDRISKLKQQKVNLEKRKMSLVTQRRYDELPLIDNEIEKLEKTIKQLLHGEKSNKPELSHKKLIDRLSALKKFCGEKTLAWKIQKWLKEVNDEVERLTRNKKVNDDVNLPSLSPKSQSPEQIEGRPFAATNAYDYPTEDSDHEDSLEEHFEPDDKKQIGDFVESLHQAIREDKPNEVEHYLISIRVLSRHGLPANLFIDESAEKSKNLFILSCAQNRVKLVDLLLKEHPQFDKDAFDHDEDTNALCYSVRNEFQEIVESLVRNGADVNVQTKKGYTPLLLAIIVKNVRILEIIASCPRTKWLTSTQVGLNALDLAVLTGKIEIVKIVVENIPVDHINSYKFGLTSLKYAMLKGFDDIVQHLLENYKKLDLSLRLQDGNTVMEYANRLKKQFPKVYSVVQKQLKQEEDPADKVASSLGKLQIK